MADCEQLERRKKWCRTQSDTVYTVHHSSSLYHGPLYIFHIRRHPEIFLYILCKNFYIYIVAPVSAPPSPLTTFSSILQITLFYDTVLGDVNELNQIK